MPGMNRSALRLADFTYELPQEKIALHPITPRDHSRLLVYQKGEITHHRFSALPEVLPPQTLLTFNQTKVIQARMHFFRETGAKIEILLLTPHDPPEPASSFQTLQACVWHCMVGNKKRWREDEILRREVRLQEQQVVLKARWIAYDQNLIQFDWSPVNISFGTLVDAIGMPPLPPYLNRAPIPEDTIRYQTVYAKEEGAVAAPTAGLHFTDQLMTRLENSAIHQAFVNLYVGAGTFAPIKTDDPLQHDMHSEKFSISLDTLYHIYQHHDHITAVGTTSMRVLESLFWLGLRCYHQETIGDFTLNLSQSEPYTWHKDKIVPVDQALQALIATMQRKQLTQLKSSTSIYIVPGYTFRMCKGLITNFHQPKSTLILLVAAFVGTNWRRIYQSALEKDYRFLSYGDASLLLPF